MIIVDYDSLVLKKKTVLPLLYSFVDLKYKAEYADQLQSGSVHKADTLSRKQRATIETVCLPIYEQIGSIKDA